MKKNSKIIILVMLGLVIVGGGVLLYIASMTNRIVCKSSDGNIIIMYNDDKLIGYTTTGLINYDFQTQRSYVEKVGIKQYFTEFKNWFEENTNGTCELK